MTSRFEQSILLGDAWHSVRPMHYLGEPTRALIFWSRRQARVWCAAAHKRYSDRPDDCRRWKFRPVKVRETLRLQP